MANVPKDAYKTPNLTFNPMNLLLITFELIDGICRPALG